MSDTTRMQRRDEITGLAGIGAALATVSATDAAAAGTAPPESQRAPTTSTPGIAAVVASTAECQRAGRVCLAHCTNFLASGVSAMADCQRAVMNMLAVTAAMADVAGFDNAAPGNIAALAASCARFCESCAEACKPHADHHPECRACLDACVECANACRALAS